MFSENGILIINDTLLKIIGDELITVKGFNDQQINEIENINEYSKGIEKRKHTVLIEHKSFDTQKTGMMKANIEDRSSIYYTGEKTRQYVNFDSFVQGGYVHFEMTGRHQRKSWFGWTFLPTNHPIYTGTVNVSGDPFNIYFNYSNQLNNSELIGVNVFVGNEGFFSKFDVTYTFQKTTSEAYGSNWHGSPTDTKGSFFRSYYRQNY